MHIQTSLCKFYPLSIRPAVVVIHEGPGHLDVLGDLCASTQDLSFSAKQAGPSLGEPERAQPRSLRVLVAQEGKDSRNDAKTQRDEAPTRTGS
jgi:hypothetical protein